MEKLRHLKYMIPSVTTPKEVRIVLLTSHRVQDMHVAVHCVYYILIFVVKVIHHHCFTSDQPNYGQCAATH